MEDTRMPRTIERHGTGPRTRLLAGAAAVGLTLAAPAMAQQQGASPGTAPKGQQQTGQQAFSGQLRTAEQALRQAQGQVSGNQPNLEQARSAVRSGLEAIGRAPQQMQGQEAWKTAQRELNEAQQALQGNQPDGQKAATQLREAADALSGLIGQAGNAADASGSTGHTPASGQASTASVGQGAQPQVNVQQPAPQITVQQQQPRITVTQPPPQVVIQQPEPRVTVQQAEPQVRVEQARPQVNVQQGGQPQVSVQRDGQPQVTVQGRDGQQSTHRNETDRSGASSSGSAPAQSGGGRPQQAAASSGGMAVQGVQALVGKNVVGSDGQEAGEVRNLLVDGSGRVRAAVVEWGGFLGLGERQALVPIARIQLGQTGNDRARLAMTRQELEALPRYDRDRVAEYGRQQGWGEGLRLFR
jgi:sporulation protein YlmC with PRC-barrel domain